MYAIPCPSILSFFFHFDPKGSFFKALFFGKKRPFSTFEAILVSLFWHQLPQPPFCWSRGVVSHLPKRIAHFRPPKILPKVAVWPPEKHYPKGGSGPTGGRTQILRSDWWLDVRQGLPLGKGGRYVYVAYFLVKWWSRVITHEMLDAGGYSGRLQALNVCHSHPCSQLRVLRAEWRLWETSPEGRIASDFGRLAWLG